MNLYPRDKSSNIETNVEKVFDDWRKVFRNDDQLIIDKYLGEKAKVIIQNKRKFTPRVVVGKGRAQSDWAQASMAGKGRGGLRREHFESANLISIEPMVQLTHF